MKIFANHAHVMPEKGAVLDGTFDNLKRIMDTCGIEKNVTFAPFNWGDLDVNLWMKQQIDGDDRFVGFGTIDFNRDDMEDQVKRAKDFGFRGLKLHAAYQKFNLLCPKAKRVYAEAERQNLIISFHTGIHWHRIADHHITMYDEIAWEFKNLRFTMEHVGGYSYFGEAVAILCNNKNTYAGLTSVFDWEMNKYWYLNEKQLHDLVHLIGAQRCIFGLDFPYNDVQKTKNGIDFIKNMNISEEEKSMILGGSLEKLLSE